MSFLWGKTAAATTKGLEIEAWADKLIEERGTRMTKLGANFCELFVADVETIVRRRIALDPWERVIGIRAKDVVTDSSSTSYNCFMTICGTTKKVLTGDEELVLLRALLAASKDQDYTVVYYTVVNDYTQGTATLDFSNAKKLAQARKDAANALLPVEGNLMQHLKERAAEQQAILEDVD